MKRNTILWLTAILYLESAFAATETDWVTLQPRMAAKSNPVTASHPSSSMTNSNSVAYANTSSQGGSASGVGSQGQSLSIDSHAVYEGAHAAVSTAAAPALTSSNDTCMGSTSVGASAVSVGISVGTTWTDTNCLMLKNAREMWNMGFKGAALARLCIDIQNREALEATGIKCPESSRKSGAIGMDGSGSSAHAGFHD